MKRTTLKDFEEWGRIGGQIKSKKKAKSSAANGKKGGRPRKVKRKPKVPVDPAA